MLGRSWDGRAWLKVSLKRMRIEGENLVSPLAKGAGLLSPFPFRRKSACGKTQLTCSRKGARVQIPLPALNLFPKRIDQKL